MKIAIVTYEYLSNGVGWGGGIESYVRLLAHGLRDLGHEVHLVCAAQEGETEGEYQDKGLWVHKIRRYRPSILSCFSFFRVLRYRFLVYKKCTDLVKRFNIEAIEYPNWLAIGLFLFLLKRKVALICRFHTPMFEQFRSTGTKASLKYKVLCWMEKMTVLQADQLVTSTKYYTNKISRVYKMDVNSVAVIPLGKDIPPEEECNISPENENIEILYVGRLEKRKGTDVLLDVIEDVLDASDRLRITLVGKDIDNRYENSFKQKNPKEIHGRVKFLGYVSDEELNRLYRDCDIFVAPSLSESFGLIFIEAMAWGKPVVALNVCGVAEVVRHEQCGILVEPSEKAHLAVALKRLVLDKDLRGNMAEAARHICETNFTTRVMSDRMAELYQETINLKLKRVS